MIKLPVNNIYEILPPNLKTAHHKALSKAFDEQMMKLLDYSEIVFFYCNVKGLPEPMLDIISNNFNIAGYDKSYDITIKSQLILEAFLVKSKLGTPYAVEKIVSTIFGSGIVEEWFEYGSEPYYFRIDSANPELLQEDEKKFLSILEKTKNVRSWLEKIRIILESETPFYVGTVYHELSVETYTSLGIDRVPEGNISLFTGPAYYEMSKETYEALI